MAALNIEHGVFFPFFFGLIIVVLCLLCSCALLQNPFDDTGDTLVNFEG